MKKKTAVIAILAIALGSYFLIDNKSQSKNEIIAKKTNKSSVSKIKTASKISKKQSLDSKKVIDQASLSKRSELTKKYFSALKNLETVVKKKNLNMNKILKETLELGEIEALADLAPEDREAFKDVMLQARMLQELQLKEDGKTLADLKKLEVYKPRWISDREKELQNVSLSSEIQGFIENKVSENSLSDNDVEYVVNQCERSKDCVEKAFYILMNNNHQLTSEQFEIINNANLI